MCLRILQFDFQNSLKREGGWGWGVGGETGGLRTGGLLYSSSPLLRPQNIFKIRSYERVFLKKVLFKPKSTVETC